MQTKAKSRRVVELEELRARLEEAEQTLAAIRNGEVDALIVNGPGGDQVFSLKGAEHPYRVFVEQMQEGAVTLERDGTILYCNQRFAEMLRMPLQQVIGAALGRFVPEEHHAALDELVRDPVREKRELPLRAADGSTISVRLSCSALPLDGIDAICLVVTDLTEQHEKRQLSEALAKLGQMQEELQQKHDELARARQMAEQANQAKDQFLAVLSHELRTPLTPVLMAAEDLEQNQELPAAVREEVTLIRRNVELEARLIDDLLDLTRIARGKLELRFDTVDVHVLIQNAIQICRQELAEKQLRLLTELEAKQHHIYGDAVRIQQCLWNLVGNAVKFTPQGGSLVIQSQSSLDRLTVRVRDSGIGIKQEMIERIFNPFEQGGRPITQQFGGLGLGLSISKRLVELHGGTLTASSDGHNRGSVFTMVLPLAERQQLASASPTGQAGQQVARALSILLVEDHEDSRRNLARLLRGLDHSVQVAGSISEALGAAREARFDVVISDLGLPDGNGIELMRELREKYQLQGICLSGFGMPEDIKRSLEAGFVEHLTKPVSFNRLASAIDQLARKL